MKKGNGVFLFALIIVAIAFGTVLLNGIPYKSEKTILYTKGEDFCIIETRNEYITREEKSIVLREVVCTEGRYFYKIDSKRLIEFEVD